MNQPICWPTTVESQLRYTYQPMPTPCARTGSASCSGDWPGRDGPGTVQGSWPAAAPVVAARPPGWGRRRLHTWDCWGSDAGAFRKSADMGSLRSGGNSFTYSSLLCGKNHGERYLRVGVFAPKNTVTEDGYGQNICYRIRRFFMVMEGRVIVDALYRLGGGRSGRKTNECNGTGERRIYTSVFARCLRIRNTALKA